MAEINKRLRTAAQAGSELRLKALLREPGCDALAQDAYGWTALILVACRGHEGCVGLLLPVSDALAQDEKGMTALIWSAYYGHEGCVRLLLPASDALAQDKNGWTASTWSRDRGHESLAQWIDDYAWAQSERAAIEIASSPERTRGQATLRM